MIVRAWIHHYQETGLWPVECLMLPPCVGVIWPVECIPYPLRYLSLALPQTYASEALRCIMYRGNRHNTRTNLVYTTQSVRLTQYTTHACCTQQTVYDQDGTQHTVYDPYSTQPIQTDTVYTHTCTNTNNICLKHTNKHIQAL